MASGVKTSLPGWRIRPQVGKRKAEAPQNPSFTDEDSEAQERAFNIRRHHDHPSSLRDFLSPLE